MALIRISGIDGIGKKLDINVDKILYTEEGVVNTPPSGSTVIAGTKVTLIHLDVPMRDRDNYPLAIFARETLDEVRELIAQAQRLEAFDERPLLEP